MILTSTLIPALVLSLTASLPSALSLSLAGVGAVTAVTLPGAALPRRLREPATASRDGALIILGASGVAPSAAASSRPTARPQRWYVFAEAAFILYQLSWALYFLRRGSLGHAMSSAVPALAVASLWTGIWTCASCRSPCRWRADPLQYCP